MVGGGKWTKFLLCSMLDPDVFVWFMLPASRMK
jgi:hypothetical protein